MFSYIFHSRSTPSCPIISIGRSVFKKSAKTTTFLMTRQHSHISVSFEPHISECSRVAQVIFPAHKNRLDGQQEMWRRSSAFASNIVKLIFFFLYQTKKIAFLEIVKDIVLNADNIPCLVSSRPIY